jgi:hypothetical protein
MFRRSLLDGSVFLKAILLCSEGVFRWKPTSMTIKVADLSTSSKTETISVEMTYRTSQSPMNAPSDKNAVGHEIINRPQICSTECEFLLLMRVINFESISQLFQLVDQEFQHHIEFWSRMVRTGMTRQRNINSYIIQREGGRLYGIANTSYQE